MKTRIMVFAKAPQAGRAKTRLIPALGPEGAASLAERLLQLTITQTLAAKAGPVELCVTPDPADPVWRTARLPSGLMLSAQGEGDLGERLTRAARRCIENGETVMLVGTDCPDLTPQRLQAAAMALESHDVVIHPAADGGYTLLGLRRFHPRIFQDIAWSTDSVAHATLCRCGELGWSVHEADRLHDIDQPEDLVHLPESLRGVLHA
ncbi:MAG: TIGR04282 family arsenosugar biosynthesis glycosyltransferase [Steroidobacteraceae bacterium]|uniref:TIGR04282 family arsenosugar biosynthesis glycosyltransferase n=1 Tax=Alcaligenes sp. SMD-FA TaxID=2991054 RepID=UPI00222652DB|nr:TIGR04282 family arsenosugar biosynthesis glycosyltransferase [Alcaligenes sp. SMD-FA]UYY86335.1 TIGR04282 family arsenosugar biosynthesis glycosyltransferase [Alcaligenes sp. SMD-FA]